MSRTGSLALAVGCIFWATTATAADCNENGTDDALDLLPGSVDLEARNVWGRAGSPLALVTGDWNRDGRLDFVTVSEGSSVSVYLGLSALEFDDPVRYVLGRSSGWGPRSLVTADLNGDGMGDLAVGIGTDEGGVHVLLGRGDGSFGDAVRYAQDFSASELHAVDLDLNGDLDLVAGGTGGVAVLSGAGNGAFENARVYELDGGIASTVITDWNGDGFPDLGGAATKSNFLFLPGAGNGSLGEPVSFDGAVAAAAGSEPEVRTWLVSDLDGDSTPDLAALRAEDRGNSLIVFRNRGDGAVEEAQVYEVGIGFARSLHSADLNRDGKPDLVAGISDSVSVLLGRDDGSFENAVRYDSEFMFPSLGYQVNGVVADLDGDSNPDILAGTRVLRGLGNGAFEVLEDAIPVNVDSLLHSGEWTYGDAGRATVMLVDINGDAHIDIVGTGGSGMECFSFSGIFVVPGRGDGTFATPEVVWEEDDWEPGPILAADLDGDGTAELIPTNRGCVQQDLTVLSRGDSGSYEETVLWEGRSFYTDVPAVSDFNGDGTPDLIRYEVHQFWTESPETDFVVFLGNGDRTFNEPVVTRFTGARTWNDEPVLLHDLDRDGRTDLVTNSWLKHSHGPGDIAILLGRGDGSFAESTLPGEGGGALLVADFTGDGSPDLASVNSGRVSVFRGRGDGTFDDAIRSGTETEGFHRKSLVTDSDGGRVADFDGDGSLDISTIVSTGIGVFFGRGDGTFDNVQSDGLEGDGFVSLVASDLNGDGLADLAATGEGGVTVFVSEGGGSFRAEIVSDTHGPGLVTTDLNGDAIPDLVAGQLPYGTDLQLLIGRGDGTFESTRFEVHGFGGSSVVAADIDGDERQDLAVVTGAGLWVVQNRTLHPTSLDRDGNGVPDECQAQFRRGDANDDGGVDISDAIRTLGVLFLGQDEITCEDASDSNDDGAVDVSDAITTLGVLFQGQGVIPFPGMNACGVDPTNDALSCEATSGCL